MLSRRRGTLNVVTGEVMSSRQIAERIAAMARPAIAVRGSSRSGPMPHNGYRPFDIAACKKGVSGLSLCQAGGGLGQNRIGAQVIAQAIRAAGGPPFTPLNTHL